MSTTDELIARLRDIATRLREPELGAEEAEALAREAADLVAEGTGVRPTVVNARFCKPIDGTLMRQLADRHELLVTIEDHAEMAGFGSAVLEVLEDMPARVLRLGLPDRFIEHGKRELLLNDVGLTPERVAARTLRALREPSRMLIAEG